MRLDEIEIAGVLVRVDVNRSGRFYIVEAAAEDHQTLGLGDTLEEAKNNARREIAKRKVKVEVPFRTMKGERGVATGRRAGSRKIQAKFTDEITGRTHSEQLDGYHDVLRSDTPDEAILQYKEYQQQRNEIYSKERALLDQWKLHLGQAVDEAVAAKAEEKVK
jgi:hypothetical protein